MASNPLIDQNLLAEFQVLTQTPVTAPNLIPWLMRLSELEAAHYQRLSSLIRQYQADTRNQEHLTPSRSISPPLRWKSPATWIG